MGDVTVAVTVSTIAEVVLLVVLKEMLRVFNSESRLMWPNECLNNNIQRSRLDYSSDMKRQQEVRVEQTKASRIENARNYI